MFPTVAAYRLVTADLGRSLSRVAEQPVVERVTSDYLDRIEDIDTIDQFLADDRVYQVAMKAFGLEEMAYAKAFMRKVLEGGIDDPDSFANRLSDRRYRDFAETFNFARYGGTATVFADARQGVVDRYVRQTLEEQQGEQDEGVRLALYFERKAASLTDPLEVLADPALLRVVQVATGLSPATSRADIDKQVELIEKRIDVASLSDPAERARFLERFAALWEVERGAAGGIPGGASLAATPFGGGGIGLSPDLLSAIQGLRLGGR